MIRSVLIKLDKMRRFDSADNWPEMHSYLNVAVSKKRAAVLKLFNRSKAKKQGGIVLRRPLIVSCLHSEFRSFLIRGFSVTISLKLRM